METVVLAQHGFVGPLYLQVHALIKQRIRAGEWRDGVAIPGEAQLSREIGVSIGTVRKAMDKLASERLITRERGRGTFLSPPSVNRGGALGQFCDASGRPLDIAITVVDVTTRTATAEEQRLLFSRQHPPHREVVVVRRRWHAGRQLICSETLTLSSARFPGLAASLPPPVDTYFDHYAGAFGVRVHDLAWGFRVSTATHRDEAQLGAEHELADLVCRRTAYDADSRAIELCDLQLSLSAGNHQFLLPQQSTLSPCANRRRERVTY